jgi:hypothetical protein
MRLNHPTVETLVKLSNLDRANLTGRTASHCWSHCCLHAAGAIAAGANSSNISVCTLLEPLLLSFTHCTPRANFCLHTHSLLSELFLFTHCTLLELIQLHCCTSSCLLAPMKHINLGVCLIYSETDCSGQPCRLFNLFDVHNDIQIYMKLIC